MSTYEAAGVDIEAGERAVALMKEHLAKSRRPEVIGDIGGFAGLFDVSALKKFDKPLLAIHRWRGNKDRDCKNPRKI